MLSLNVQSPRAKRSPEASTCICFRMKVLDLGGRRTFLRSVATIEVRLRIRQSLNPQCCSETSTPQFAESYFHRASYSGAVAEQATHENFLAYGVLKTRRAVMSVRKETYSFMISCFTDILTTATGVRSDPQSGQLARLGRAVRDDQFLCADFAVVSRVPGK